MEKKNIVIFILVLALVFMGGSYAYVAKDNKSVNQGQSFSVSLSDISLVASSGNAKSSDAYISGSGVLVKPTLNEAGDTAEYQFMIKNNGNSDALVESISGIRKLNEARPDLNVFVTGVNAGDIIKKGDTLTCTLHLSLKEGSTAFNSPVNIAFTFSQI